MSISKLSVTFQCAIWLSLINQSCLALPGEITNVSVNMSGTIIATATCVINGADPIAIEFGDVYISNIDGDTYRKRIDYSVSCQGDPEGKTIQMQVAGNGAAFDGALLKTDVSGLGIKLLNNGSPLALNHWVNLDPNNVPILEGALVKESGADFINGQEFNSTATLKVDYN